MKAYSVVMLVCEICLDSSEDGMPFDTNDGCDYSCERCGRNLTEMSNSFGETELEICDSCLMVSSYGFDDLYVSYEGIDKEAVAIGLKKWGTLDTTGRYNDPFFSSSPCECCESKLSGNRTLTIARSNKVI